MALWNAGDTKLWIEPNEYPVHKQLLDEGRDRNETLEDFLDGYLGGLPNVTVRELQESLKQLGHTNVWDRTISGELQRRGWKTKRTSKGRFWVPPEN